jgi:preprotein translocase subunit SecG
VVGIGMADDDLMNMAISVLLQRGSGNGAGRHIYYGNSALLRDYRAISMTHV